MNKDDTYNAFLVIKYIETLINKNKIEGRKAMRQLRKNLRSRTDEFILQFGNFKGDLYALKGRWEDCYNKLIKGGNN